MSGNWLHNIKHVTPGEPVQAGVVNRPDRTLEERTEYLKDRLDASAVGQAIFDHNATIATDVLPRPSGVLELHLAPLRKSIGCYRSRPDHKYVCGAAVF